jgi:tRNA(Met) C34 N-acetyltransferase TmcA
MSGSDDLWSDVYSNDFRKRMLNLLGYEFRDLTCSLALSVLNPPQLAKANEN